MNNVDLDLAHRFADASPPLPDISNWGPIARRRHTRQRRITALSITAVAAVAATSALALGVLQQPGEESHTATEPSSTQPTDDTDAPSPVESGPDVVATNSTDERLWLFLPWGNQSDIPPGGTVTFQSGCTEAMPLRAETLSGEIVDYYDACTADGRWAIESTAPFTEADLTTVGTVTGTVTLRTTSRSEPVTRAGVVFSGPTLRSASVGREGRFTAELSAGVYTINIASSAIPPGPGVTRCPTETTVEVDAGTTTEIELFCDR